MRLCRLTEFPTRSPAAIASRCEPVLDELLMDSRDEPVGEREAMRRGRCRRRWRMWRICCKKLECRQKGTARVEAGVLNVDGASVRPANGVDEAVFEFLLI
jgi:hypothetical protein